MELRRYLRLLKRHLLVVLACVLAGLLAGYFATPRGAKYRTTTLVYVGTIQLSTNPNQLFAVPGLNQILQTFTQMIPSPVIAEKAVAATGVSRSPQAVASEVKATVVTGTNLIQVSVTDADPVVSQKLANGVSNAFVSQIRSYSPGSTGAPGTVPVEPAYVFQQAPLPVAPLSTGMTRHLLLGGVFGFVGAILLVLLLDYVDISVKSPDDLERRLDLPVLAIIPLSRSGLNLRQGARRTRESSDV